MQSKFWVFYCCSVPRKQRRTEGNETAVALTVLLSRGWRVQEYGWKQRTPSLTSSMLWETERNRLIQGFTWGLMAVLFSSLRPS